MPPPLAPALAQAAAAPETDPFSFPAAPAAPEASPFWAAAAAAPPPPPVPVFAPQPVAHRVAVQPVAAPMTRRNLDDLPDFVDGQARSRRVALIVFAVAALALLGTIAAAIASNFRPT